MLRSGTLAAAVGLCASVALAASSASALAGERPPEAPAADASRAKEAAPASGPRLRAGIAAGGGYFWRSGPSFGIGHLDARLGGQLGDVVAIYAQLQAGGWGAGGGSGQSFDTGGSVLSGTAIVDFTMGDAFFLGVGAGGGAFRADPTGTLHLRMGGYPIVAHGDDGMRRNGFMIGADLRAYLSPIAVGISPTLSLGYEAF